MAKSKLGEAIALAAEQFKKKTDLGGNPYILHCLRVMYKVQHLGEQAQIAAVLHDVVEDADNPTDAASDIFRLFGPEISNMVELLTKKKQEDYLSEYIKRVACYPITTAIKLADLEDNADITRLKGLSKKDFDRLEKYHRAYVYLKDIQ